MMALKAALILCLGLTLFGGPPTKAREGSSTPSELQARSFHYSFTNRRVLVTGGAVGLGRTIVQKFYDDNARVFVFVPDSYDRMPTRLKQELPKVTTICVDLLKWNETRAAVETILPLDHLVNNAAIVIPNPLHQATEADFDQQFGVNVKALLIVSARFVKGILDHHQKEGGTIVNISSIGDEVPTPPTGINCASKAAVAMFTKVMAVEFAMANNHIRVNTVCPGFVQSASVLEEVGSSSLWFTLVQVLVVCLILQSGLLKSKAVVFLFIIASYLPGTAAQQEGTITLRQTWSQAICQYVITFGVLFLCGAACYIVYLLWDIQNSLAQLLRLGNLIMPLLTQVRDILTHMRDVTLPGIAETLQNIIDMIGGRRRGG